MAVPPVLADLVSAPNAPTRSGRGGRDRRSKFYELSDNLALNVPLGAVVSGVVRRVARVGRRRAKFSTSVSLIYGGWLPQVPGFVAGWRVSRTGRGLVRAAHRSIACTSGLRGPAPPHPSGSGLSDGAMEQWQRPRGNRRARARTRR